MIVCKCNTVMKKISDEGYDISSHYNVKYTCPNCNLLCSVVYQPVKMTWFDSKGNKMLDDKVRATT